MEACALWCHQPEYREPVADSAEQVLAAVDAAVCGGREDHLHEVACGDGLAYISVVVAGLEV